MNRRNFIKTIATASFGATLLPQELLKTNTETTQENNEQLLKEKFNANTEKLSFQEQIDNIENDFNNNTYEIKTEKQLGVNKPISVAPELFCVALYGKEKNKKRAEEIIKQNLENNKDAFLESGLPSNARKRPANKLKPEIQNKLKQEGKIDLEGKTFMIYPMDAFSYLLNYALSIKCVWKELISEKQKELIEPLIKSLKYLKNSLSQSDGLFVRYYMPDGELGSDSIAPDDSLGVPLESLVRIVKILTEIGENKISTELQIMITNIWKKADEKLLRTGKLGESQKNVAVFAGNTTLKNNTIDTTQNSLDFPADGSRTINARIEYIKLLLSQNKIELASKNTLTAFRELRFIIKATAITSTEPVYNKENPKEILEDFTEKNKNKYMQSWFISEQDENNVFQVKRCMCIWENENTHKEWFDMFFYCLNFLHNKNNWKKFDSEIINEIHEIKQELIKFIYRFIQQTNITDTEQVKKLCNLLLVKQTDSFLLDGDKIYPGT